MVATKRYSVIDPETGRLDPTIFTDQAIYDEEMEKIFGRAWQMIGHVSLVPNPGDFFHTYMGEDPVILTRDSQGQLHALLNMCRHRGNRVTRFDDGNAETFMCTYHAWTYKNDGSLDYVPGEEEAYYGELNKAEMGLIQARVQVYAGIVFACWAQDAPSLEDYLGDARWYLDTAFNRTDGGMVALGPQKWIEPVNWKTPVDNCSDNYHGPVTHGPTSRVIGSFLGMPRRIGHQALFSAPNKHLFVNGHSLTIAERESADQPRTVHGLAKENQQEYHDYYTGTVSEVERRLGEFRANKVLLSNHSLFPNGVLGFRLALPRGPLKTEFWHFVMVEKDMPDGVKDTIRIGSMANNGAAGLFEQDDVDNWRQMSESGKSPMMRKHTHTLSMGVGHSGPDELYPGSVSERYISEHNQRHFYNRWEEFMNSESWADIPLDPQIAIYEGTAGVEG